MNDLLFVRPFAICLLAALATSLGTASPRVESNSISIRHDMLLLRDTKSIESALLTWPWPLGRQPVGKNVSELADDAASRFQDIYDDENDIEIRPAIVSISGGSDRLPFRSFGSQPREEFESSLSASWLGDWVAGNLSLTYAHDASDGDDFRLDGSYIGIAAGNWVAAVDQVERWWGPGWDGSLILSNSARPVPALSLTRISPDPFDWKLLKWIGPWTFTTFMGQLDNVEPIRENGIRVGSDARLFGMRIDFSPFGWDWIDIGLNRSAQWAGEGRPGSLSTFGKLLLGEDNSVPGSETDRSNEPGNQLAGVDYRWSIEEWGFSHYGQLAGEDEETFLPDANMLLFGIEKWGDLKNLNSTYRIYYEWADTRAGHLVADPRRNRAFNVAYNHGIYHSGYRSKGKAIGHAMDGDSLMRSIGAFVVNENGNLLGAKTRNYSINRDGGGRHSITTDAIDGWSFEVFGEITLESGLFEAWENQDVQLNFGIHYIDESNRRTGDSDSDVGGYLGLTKRL